MRELPPQTPAWMRWHLGTAATSSRDELYGDESDGNESDGQQIVAATNPETSDEWREKAAKRDTVVDSPSLSPPQKSEEDCEFLPTGRPFLCSTFVPRRSRRYKPAASDALSESNEVGPANERSRGEPTMQQPETSFGEHTASVSSITAQRNSAQTQIGDNFQSSSTI